MTTNIEIPDPRLVGLCGDSTQQHTLAWLMGEDSPGRRYVEVSTRDLARDLVRSMHLDFANASLDDLLDNADWASVLANDTPAAVLAGQAVERAHRALSEAAPPYALDDEAIEHAANLLATGSSVLITGVDTVELAAKIRNLGGIVVRLDAPAAIHGTPIGATATAAIDLAIPLTGPGQLSPREAMAAINTCLTGRTNTVARAA